MNSGAAVQDSPPGVVDALGRVVVAYNSLSPASLPQLLDLYADNAHFKDPFNDVHGSAEIGRIFRHMYATLEAPTFEVSHQFQSGQAAMLRWRFRFRLNGRDFDIPGSSALEFSDDGKVIDHVDFWDATEHLWAKLPLVGAPVRWLRKRFSSAAFSG